MKDHYTVTSPSGWRVSFLVPTSRASIAIRTEGDGAYTTIQLLTDDVVTLMLLKRALEAQIDVMQPGLVGPLPPGDPNEFDAIKIMYEVDRRWKEGNHEPSNG